MKKTYVILIVLLLFAVSSNAQCAMCRAVLESEGSESTAKSINNGIKYLMLFPYLLVGGLGYYIYWKFRKS